MKAARTLAVAAAIGAAALTAGCAESATVQANPVWSATVPDYGVEYSKTTNVFPFYSKNVTAYGDRLEETGNVLLFISWSKTTARSGPEANAGGFEAEVVGESEPAEDFSAAPAEGLAGEPLEEIAAQSLEEEAPQ